MEIKNIIFDLGGVILNIDYNLTAAAFKKLGVSNFDELYSQAQQSHLFDQLETGRISPGDFRKEVRKISGLSLTDLQIDSAWNAMLLDLPLERLTLLKDLKKDQYRLFLLSNTNEIHYQAYTKNLLKEHGVEGLEPFFEQSFFSHAIGKRKPDVSTFEFVLNQANIKPVHTIFIDDSIQHVEGAKKAGIQAFHLQEDIVEFFDKIF